MKGVTVGPAMLGSYHPALAHNEPGQVAGGLLGPGSLGGSELL
jgi:hypothetical protein